MTKNSNKKTKYLTKNGFKFSKTAIIKALSKGRTPQQKLEVGPDSSLYHILNSLYLKSIADFVNVFFVIYIYTFFGIFRRPDVAGALLQSPSLLIHLFIKSVSDPLQNTFNSKPYELGI